MSTPIPQAPDATIDDTAVDAAAVRAQKIDTLAQTLFTELAHAELRKPPTERTTDAVLWKQARREATVQVRREQIRQRAKTAATETVTSVYADVKSAVHRNRAQLAPWKIATPYAAVGEAAYLLAEYGSGSPIGISALCAATTAGASLIAWRKKLQAKTPAKFTERLKASLAMLCGWTTAMPLVHGTGQAGMWLALAGGAAWMGLPWWREHDHPIPLPDDIAELNVVEIQEATEAEKQDALTQRIRGIVQAWHARIGRERGPVAGATLTYLGSNDSVDEYEILLDQDGAVTRDQLKQPQVHRRIALAIGVLEDKLSFEFTKHPARVIMRQLITEPSFTYDGPIVLCDGKPVHSRWEITPGAAVDIVYGHYLDGRGYTAYRVIDAGSVNSMFVLGGTGSGKTKLMETIAIGLRFLGVHILYIDGQGGASSAALNDHADETFPFTENGVRELSATVSAIMRARNAELRERRELKNRYTYDPNRPPVIVILEEGHEVFCMPRMAGKQKLGTYGEVFGQYGQQTRKLGVGILTASQDFDLTATFGGSARLRSALLAGNNFAAMRLPDKSRIGMLPASCPALDTLPPKGYGFSPFGDRPDALWRGPNLDASDREPEEWMTSFEPGVLDEHTAQGVAAAALSADEPDDEEGDDTSGANENKVVRFPFGSHATEASQREPGEEDAPTGDVEPLTPAEQRVMDVLIETPQTPTTLGRALDMTSQVAGRHLQKLAKKGHAVRMEDGRYMAKV